MLLFFITFRITRSKLSFDLLLLVFQLILYANHFCMIFLQLLSSQLLLALIASNRPLLAVVKMILPFLLDHLRLAIITLFKLHELALAFILLSIVIDRQIDRYQLLYAAGLLVKAANLNFRQTFQYLFVIQLLANKFCIAFLRFRAFVVLALYYTLFQALIWQFLHIKG